MAKNIIIIGGGIIGASCAMELTQKGAQVTLIEKNKIGYGCSYGNAGWLTPCFAMPLPMPGMMMKSIKWLFDPDSPLYIKPSPSLLLARWMTRFLFSMNEKKANQSIEWLVELSQRSLKLYNELNEKYPQAFHLKQKGLLMVSRTADGLSAIEDELHRVSKFQIAGKKMSPDEVSAFEPAIKDRVLGGVYFPNEAHAEPLLVVQTIAEEARKQGAKFHEDCEVLGFNLDNNKIQSVITPYGKLTADLFILATGSWSHQLAKKIQVDVPIMGGKGYAMIVPPLEKQPQQPIMIAEKKIAITPRSSSLRIAGTLELVNQDFSITERRVQAIQNGAREFLHLPKNLEIKELWSGLRPCTPDGLPMLGWSKKVHNLILACGHQMLGLQTGLGSGQFIADLIMEDTQIKKPLY